MVHLVKAPIIEQNTNIKRTFDEEDQTNRMVLHMDVKARLVVTSKRTLGLILSTWADMIGPVEEQVDISRD